MVNKDENGISKKKESFMAKAPLIETAVLGSMALLVYTTIYPGSPVEMSVSQNIKEASLRYAESKGEELDTATMTIFGKTLSKEKIDIVDIKKAPIKMIAGISNNRNTESNTLLKIMDRVKRDKNISETDRLVILSGILKSEKATPAIEKNIIEETDSPWVLSSAIRKITKDQNKEQVIAYTASLNRRVLDKLDIKKVPDSFLLGMAKNENITKKEAEEIVENAFLDRDMDRQDISLIMENMLLNKNGRDYMMKKMEESGMIGFSIVEKNMQSNAVWSNVPFETVEIKSTIDNKEETTENITIKEKR